VKTEEADLRLLGPDGLVDPDARGRHADVEGVLRQGLDAELAGRYPDAERLYARAVALDPADATALRYLGELYRHQTGDWKQARATFARVLTMPADPIARAVALHGLGKMTIHSGRYAEGLAMFEQSLAAYPLPITYRNLAVYWFSERQAEKAAGFMRQALALDPDDRYNQIFAAVYLAAAGHKDEAAKIAAANHDVLEASYNLAAIWAQVGDRKKAMELLRRHFYTYERFDAVRSMEMQEARDDYMFASLHADPEFIALTRKADGHSM
jgi:tetratricopeptide (TPR) repeat protein